MRGDGLGEEEERSGRIGFPAYIWHISSAVLKVRLGHDLGAPSSDQVPPSGSKVRGSHTGILVVGDLWAIDERRRWIRGCPWEWDQELPGAGPKEIQVERQFHLIKQNSEIV